MEATTFLTTRAPGFEGPNNCGPTCAINWMRALEPTAGAWVPDAAGAHGELMRGMHVGRFGAQMWLFRGGLRRYARGHGVPLRVRTHLIVTQRRLERALRRGPVPLCMLANKKYGWHWVLVLGARREGDELMLRVADGWTPDVQEIAYAKTGPGRNMAAVRG